MIQLRIESCWFFLTFKKYNYENSSVMNKIDLLIGFLLFFIFPLKGQQINIEVINNTPSCWGICCGEAEVTTSGTNPPFYYQWSTGVIGTNIQNLTPGAYTVTVTDDVNSTATKTIVIGELGVINEVEEFVSQSCHGEEDVVLKSKVIEGIPPFLFRIYDDQENLIEISSPTPDSTYFFENLKGGATYRITVNDDRTCLTENFFTTNEEPVFLSEIGPDILLDPGEQSTLLALFNQIPVSISWVPTTGLSCSDCPDPIVTASSENICYTMTALNENGCETIDSICVIVETNSLETGIQNIKQFDLFPNPVQNELIIQGDFSEKISIEVFDFYGKKIQPDFISQNENSAIINLENNPPGIYLVKIENENGIILSVKKIILAN